MNIESKFNIDDLLKHKYDNHPNGIHCFQVKEVVSQSCYAGTQVFYKCRALIAAKIYANSFKKEGEFTWDIGHNISKDFSKVAWEQYREDELMLLDEESKKVFENTVS